MKLSSTLLGLMWLSATTFVLCISVGFLCFGPLCGSGCLSFNLRRKVVLGMFHCYANGHLLTALNTIQHLVYDYIYHNGQKNDREKKQPEMPLNDLINVTIILQETTYSYL